MHGEKSAHLEWNEDQLARLRKLWAEGHSTAEIGRRLGVSKNAVVGKAHRLDLPARPSPIRRDSSGAAPQRPAPRRIAGPTLPQLGSITTFAAIPSVVTAEPAHSAVVVQFTPRQSAHVVEESPLDRIEVEADAPPRFVLVPVRPDSKKPLCDWPIGDPGSSTFHFCNAESILRKPYCLSHAQIAYVKVRDRREDAA